MTHLQDLVEALSAKDTWFIPRKHDQAAWERNPDGTYAGFEEIIPYGEQLLGAIMSVNQFGHVGGIAARMSVQ